MSLNNLIQYRKERKAHARLTDTDRHTLCSALADRALKGMSNIEIVGRSPAAYGKKITDNHRCFVWDEIYENYSSLDDSDLFKIANIGQ